MRLETPARPSTINVNVANNPVPAGFYDEVVIGTGVTFPTAFEFLPDGRMLIAEFRGRVMIAQPGASTPDATPVLTLTNIFDEDVTVGGERGLVNVVADPNFAANGYIYLFYTAASPQRDRVSRFTMTGNTASPASEFVVWQAIANSTSTDHHGGGLDSAQTGRFTSPRETMARPRRRSRSPAITVSFCGSIPTARFRPTTRSSTAPDRTSMPFGRGASAILIGSRSTRSPAASISVTSVRTRLRK